MEDLDGVMLCNLFKLTVCMCIFSGVVSAFLDNVTTLLLLSPVTIRLCKMIAPDNVEKLAIPLLISNAGKERKVSNLLLNKCLSVW